MTSDIVVQNEPLGFTNWSLKAPVTAMEAGLSPLSLTAA